MKGTQKVIGARHGLGVRRLGASLNNPCIVGKYR